MVNTFHRKMLRFCFLLLLLVNKGFSVSVGVSAEKPCGCYEACSKNFTTNSVQDGQKIGACQRGCRFYLLILHTSHERNPAKDSAKAQDGCHLSCSESYKDPYEISACNFGCTTLEAARILCTTIEKPLTQVSYSLVIEESDVLIHPGEPDPDDALTDPGLRKQFEKTLEAVLDAKPKLPEIHFRNLPAKNKETITEFSHINFKCPKFYGLDSKLEFRNGKIIIGDLYLFVGVFVFVVICFLLGHHIEARSVGKQSGDPKNPKKDDFEDKDTLMNPHLEDEWDIPLGKYDLPDYSYDTKDDILPPADLKVQVPLLDEITLVFHDNQESKVMPSNEDIPKL